MHITDFDFSALRYDPTKKTEIKRLLNDYPNAFSDMLYENMNLMKYHDNIIKYIIIVYDMNSPLWQSIKQHNERKVKALFLAGFETNSMGRFETEIENALLYGKDRGVAQLITRYVYLFNSIDFSELVGMIELNSQLLIDIHNAKTNNQTFKQLSDTSSRIKELTSIVFGGKETKEIEEQLYELLSMSRISFRPEKVAELYSNGRHDDIFAKDIYGVYKNKKSERKKAHGDL